MEGGCHGPPGAPVLRPAVEVLWRDTESARGPSLVENPALAQRLNPNAAVRNDAQVSSTS